MFISAHYYLLFFLTSAFSELLKALHHTEDVTRQGIHLCVFLFFYYSYSIQVPLCHCFDIGNLFVLMQGKHFL